MTYRKSLFFFICLTLCSLLQPHVAPAAIVIQYQGSTFDMVDGTAFDLGGDRIWGTFTFNAVGDSQATAMVLSVTSNGVETTLFDLPDVGNAPAGVTVGTNSFSNWLAGLPTQWDVTVFGNVLGGLGEEQISIDHQLGDLAAIDLLSPTGSTAMSFAGGTMTVAAVPEPSSLAFTGVGLSILLYRQRRAGSGKNKC